MGELAGLVGTFIGFILTLFVFSYLFGGDNPLFRVAIHIFVGVSAAIVFMMAFRNVLWPHLVLPLLNGDLKALLLLALCLMLLAKASRRLSGLGKPVMAFLVGVAAAAAIGGAVIGTLFPQMLATAGLFDPEAIAQNGGEGFGQLMGYVNALIMLAGTVFVLLYFQFNVRTANRGAAKKSLLMRSISGAGEFFIAITFGVLFAGVYSASLTALIERLNSIVQLIWSLISFS